MNVTLLIATRNRPLKLMKTIESVPVIDWLRILVVCDGDRETHDMLKADQPHANLFPIRTKRHVGSVAARNQGCAIINRNHAILYGTDDIVFEPGCIEAGRDLMLNKFPDGNGVIGFTQDFKHHITGVAMVGPVFMARYPNRELFCPYYWHFAAQEVGELATKLGLFEKLQSPLVKHISPASGRAEEDQTHMEARVRKAEDMETMRMRKDSGDIWGMGDEAAQK